MHGTSFASNCRNLLQRNGCETTCELERALAIVLGELLNLPNIQCDECTMLRQQPSCTQLDRGCSAAAATNKTRLQSEIGRRSTGVLSRHVQRTCQPRQRQCAVAQHTAQEPTQPETKTVEQARIRTCFYIEMCRIVSSCNQDQACGAGAHTLDAPDKSRFCFLQLFDEKETYHDNWWDRMMIRFFSTSMSQELGGAVTSYVFTCRMLARILSLDTRGRSSTALQADVSPRLGLPVHCSTRCRTRDCSTGLPHSDDYDGFVTLSKEIMRGRNTPGQHLTVAGADFVTYPVCMHVLWPHAADCNFLMRIAQLHPSAPCLRNYSISTFATLLTRRCAAAAAAA